MKNLSTDIAVIGGGASGLMVAQRAAEMGVRVLVIEKMDRPGRKLAITGKGRGNLTTTHDVKTALDKFGPNGRFLRGAFSRFYNTELIAFLGEMGIDIIEEQGRRVFPAEHRAVDVVDVWVQELRNRGVVFHTGCRVNGLVISDDHIAGVETAKGEISARCVVVATGGMSYPGTGSSGDGYALASHVGHSVVDPVPALVPLEIRGDIPSKLDALTLKNVELTLSIDGRTLHKEFGDILFTPWGITGPAALSISKHASLNSGRDVSLIVNFKPGLTSEQLDNRLRRDFETMGAKSVKEILGGLLPRRAVPVFLDLWKVPEKLQGGQVSRTQRAELARLLHGLELSVSGTRSMEEAIITCGGVSLKEVNPKTMESRLVAGLYICGELLDLDACTGGFNLQAAFSTGWVAGDSAARAALESR